MLELLFLMLKHLWLSLALLLFLIHLSDPTSLLTSSYAVFCLKKTNLPRLSCPFSCLFILILSLFPICLLSFSSPPFLSSRPHPPPLLFSPFLFSPLLSSPLRFSSLLLSYLLSLYLLSCPLLSSSLLCSSLLPSPLLPSSLLSSPRLVSSLLSSPPLSSFPRTSLWSTR